MSISVKGKDNLTKNDTIALTPIDARTSRYAYPKLILCFTNKHKIGRKIKTNVNMEIKGEFKIIRSNTHSNGYCKANEYY